ncbi:hypothetical protein [Nocardia wallacei]|uniref:hypothetical protein n=1 Tax=Nocardia wallacei TaxID=480035 RepID=UPI0024552792|nr:hypothetical protein [Nocardia wallacei]
MKSLTCESLTEIAVFGVHCDDIAIGAGGTLLMLAGANPGCDPAAPEFRNHLVLRYEPSQRHRHWFDERTFLGLARIRGVQCGTEFA